MSYNGRLLKAREDYKPFRHGEAQAVSKIVGGIVASKNLFRKICGEAMLICTFFAEVVFEAFSMHKPMMLQLGRLTLKTTEGDVSRVTQSTASTAPG